MVSHPPDEPGDPQDRSGPVDPENTPEPEPVSAGISAVASPAEAGTDSGERPGGWRGIWGVVLRVWRGHPVVVVGGAALAVVLVVSLVLVVDTHTGPERVVRDYFDAISEGEVEEALEIAGVKEPPTGEEATFLDSDALNYEWETVSVQERELPGDETEVEVRLRDPDGETVNTIMALSQEDGTWRIDDPIVETSLDISVLWYYDVNGKRAPVNEETLGEEYAFLPGFYRFYEEVPDEVELEPQEGWLAPTEDRSEISVEDWPRLSEGDPGAVVEGVPALTEEGEETAQQKINAYIDTCAGKNPSNASDGCPFSVRSPRSIDVGDESLLIEGDVRWEVVEYPVVTAPYGSTRLEGSSFDVTDRERGLVELSGTGETDDGEETDFTIECEINTERLFIGFNDEGEMGVLPQNKLPIHTKDEQARLAPIEPPDTCSRL